MAQRLHLLFGGEFVDPVGMFSDHASAYSAWRREAQRTVDDAQMRYFIAHLHRLRDEERETSPTEEVEA